jgi:hypothetical protein
LCSSVLRLPLGRSLGVLSSGTEHFRREQRQIVFGRREIVTTVRECQRRLLRSKEAQAVGRQQQGDFPDGKRGVVSFIDRQKHVARGQSGEGELQRHRRQVWIGVQPNPAVERHQLRTATRVRRLAHERHRTAKHARGRIDRQPPHWQMLVGQLQCAPRLPWRGLDTCRRLRPGGEVNVDTVRFVAALHQVRNLPSRAIENPHVGEAAVGSCAVRKHRRIEWRRNESSGTGRDGARVTKLAHIELGARRGHRRSGCGRGVGGRHGRRFAPNCLCCCLDAHRFARRFKSDSQRIESSTAVAVTTARSAKAAPAGMSCQSAYPKKNVENRIAMARFAAAED